MLELEGMTWQNIARFFLLSGHACMHVLVGTLAVANNGGDSLRKKSVSIATTSRIHVACGAAAAPFVDSN